MYTAPYASASGRNRQSFRKMKHLDFEGAPQVTLPVCNLGLSSAGWLERNRIQLFQMKSHTSSIFFSLVG